MKFALLSAATMAVALLAGASHAQDSSTSDPNASPRPSAQAPSRDTPSAPSAATRGSNVSANTNVILVTNGPIPDTPENRARYGKPLSAAGRNSKPAGN